MIVTFDYDSSRKLGVLKTDLLDFIRHKFSQYDETAKIKRRVTGFKYIPTRLYSITKAGKFELGLTVDILKVLKEECPIYRVLFTEEFKKAFFSSYEFADSPLAEINTPPNYQERYYQEESIKRALKIGNGIFLLKTAAGKTYILGKLIATIQKYKPKTKTLIIVPTIQLIEQVYNDFSYFGYDMSTVSKWSGSYSLNEKSDIIIASSNILLSKSQDVSILSSIDLLVVDECHMLKKDTQISKLIKSIKTNHKFGFTGTLPEELIDQWAVIGKLGPVIYTISRQELVENKFISDAEIKIVLIDYKSKPNYKDIEYNKDAILSPANSLLNYEIEINFLYKNEFRNNIIKSVCEKLDKNVLIAVENIEHGNILYETLKKSSNKNVFFIRGNVEVSEREKIKQTMEETNNVICIAISKIFSTGINIKNLHYILFAIAGEAKVKIIQSIGRGVRLHENKNKLYIFDIADNLKYGRRHLRRRKEIYEEEGFKIKTIQIREDA